MQCWLLVLRYLIFPQFPLGLPFKDWQQHFFPRPLTAAAWFLFLPHLTALLPAHKGPGSLPWCCLRTSVNNIISALEMFEITVLPYTMKGKLLNLSILGNMEEQAYLTKKAFSTCTGPANNYCTFLWAILQIPPRLKRKKIRMPSTTLASIHSQHMHNYLPLIGTHSEISDNLTQIKHCSSLTDTAHIAR